MACLLQATRRPSLLAAELVSGIFRKEFRSTNPLSSGLAAKFVAMLRDVQLSATFGMHAFSARTALRGFELGYSYSHASLTEAQAIESKLFLNIGSTFPISQPLLA